MKFFAFSQFLKLSHGTSRRLLSSKNFIRPEYITKLRECYLYEETQQLVVPQFKRALLYGNNIAVKDNNGEYTYFQLYLQSKRLSRQIANICGSCSCSTVGLLCANDVLSILCLWACWMAGQVVMPVVIGPQCTYEDLPSLLSSAKVKMIINAKSEQVESNNVANLLGISHIAIDHLFMKQQNHSFNLNREVFIADNLVFFEGLLQNNFYTTSNALSLYSKPEEKTEKWNIVQVSHKHLDTQIKILSQTWNVRQEDRILNVFSTQHVNTFLGCTLFALNMGSCLQLLEPYDPTSAWSTIMAINMPAKERVNVVIADHSAYQDLIAEYDKVLAKNNCMVDYIKDYCSNKIRLMVACFDKLSTETYSRWLEITGHTLFENPDIFNMAAVQRLNGDISKEKKFDVSKTSLSSGVFKFRIINSSNKILLECNGNSTRMLYTSSPTIVGTLWIASSNNNDATDGEDDIPYCSTGDVVMYQDGVFKFVGRYIQQ